MALTYDDKQFLITKNVIKSDWMISDVLGCEMKDFLVNNLGFSDPLYDIPLSILRNKLMAVADLPAADLVDPYVALANIFKSIFQTDLIGLSGINSSPSTNVRYRRTEGKKFVAISQDAVYVNNDKFMRRVATITAGSNLNAFCCNNTGTVIYIGGDFTEINGIACNSIAKITIADISDASSLITVEQPGAGFNDVVTSVEEIGGVIYAGGWFDHSGATPISKLAKLDTTSTPVWVEVTNTTINDPVNAIKENPVSGDIFIGTGVFGPGSSNSRLFKIVEGALVPIVFPEITVDPNGYISNGVIYDIEFNTNATKMILAGKFNSTCTGNDNDLLIVNTADFTTMPYGFNFPPPSEIKSVKYISGWNFDGISIVGNITAINYTDPDTTLPVTVPCQGQATLNSILIGSLVTAGTLMKTSSGSEKITCQGNLAAGNVDMIYGGDFSKIGVANNDVKSYDAATRTELLHTKFHPNCFSVSVGTDYIDNYQSCTNYENLLYFIKLKPFETPPP